MTVSSPPHDRPISLIIEDEDDIAYVFGIALTRAGFDTEIVGNGKAALDRLATLTPDLLILDLHLPKLSGEEVLSWIRAEERLAKMRVIITSANPRWVERIEQEGDFVLIKPVSFEQLCGLAARLKPQT